MSGLQKRTLKLKPGSSGSNCEQVRHQTRTCKKRNFFFLFFFKNNLTNFNWIWLACRYSKGTWTECTEGERTRQDTLKSHQASNSECEAVRVVRRKCKSSKDPLLIIFLIIFSIFLIAFIHKLTFDTVSVSFFSSSDNNCKYAKADWGPCENGFKSKTFTLESGSGSECEATKVIKRACSHEKKNKNGVRRANRRQKNKKNRLENKKQSSNESVDEED